MVKDKKTVLPIYLIGEAYDGEKKHKCSTALVFHRKEFSTWNWFGGKNKYKFQKMMEKKLLLIKL